MKAYSLDFRQKIVETYFKEAISQRNVAKRPTSPKVLLAEKP